MFLLDETKLKIYFVNIVLNFLNLAIFWNIFFLQIIIDKDIYAQNIETNTFKISHEFQSVPGLWPKL